MFPPTNHQIRCRFNKIFDGNADDIEQEAMCAMYGVYDSMGLYMNLFDAYKMFKAVYTADDDEDYGENDKMEIDEEASTNNKKKKNSKHEISTDDESESESESVHRNMSEKEKQNQIEFRMSIDDLRFCGFVKVTNRKEQSLMKTADLL